MLTQTRYWPIFFLATQGIGSFFHHTNVPYQDEAMADLSIPSAYQEGFLKARAENPELAIKYIEQTTIDDPLADAVIDALAAFDPGDANRLIKAAMEQDGRVLADAPEELRNFFDELETKPDWYDPKALYPGLSCISHAFRPVHSRVFPGHGAQRRHLDRQVLLRQRPGSGAVSACAESVKTQGTSSRS